MASLLPIGERLRERSVEQRVPVNVMIELTYRCNLRCRHCYLEGLPPSREPELSTDEIVDLLDQLADIGTLYLAFTGGETLLRPDLGTLIDAAAERGFATRLFTNGTLLTEEWIRRLARLGTVSLDVSVHGATAETHDWMTRCPGSFARALGAVELARASGVHTILKMPLTHRNLAERQAVKEIAAGLRAALVVDPVVTARHCGARDSLCLRLGHSELVDLFREEKVGPPGPDGLTCNAGVNTAVVTPFGEVRPCVQLLLDCGRIGARSFSEIWTGNETLKILREMTDKDIVGCNECPRKDACNRCPGMALLEDGDLLGPSSSACLVAAAQAEAAFLP